MGKIAISPDFTKTSIIKCDICSEFGIKLSPVFGKGRTLAKLTVYHLIIAFKYVYQRATLMRTNCTVDRIRIYS
jgi:hypothetical protein